MPCADGKRGLNGRHCPYVETRPRSVEETHAWEILMACQSQIRLSPSGCPVGIDMNAAMKMAEIKNAASPVVIDLLTAGERAICEAFKPESENG